jgi:hypothetical protein
VAREQHVQREDLNSLYIFPLSMSGLNWQVRLAPRIKQNPPGGMRALCLFGMYTMLSDNRERWMYLMYDRGTICTDTPRIKTKPAGGMRALCLTGMFTMLDNRNNGCTGHVRGRDTLYNRNVKGKYKV